MPGFQRFGDFYGVYNRVYIYNIYIYVSLQTASVIRNMMNYDVVCFAAYCQTNPCGWIMDMHLDVQCFFSSCLMQWFTHWISKPPSWFGWFYYSNHGHNYCLFESLKLFVKCLQWLFFLGEGSYSSVAKGSTNVNVVVLNLGFRTGFCTSPAFIPAYAHPQKDTNVIQSVSIML
jgi:hypothetical protein